MVPNSIKPEYTIYLFTEEFPFGINSEKAFLANEIKYLSLISKRIIVVPRLINKDQTSFDEFEIDISLANSLKNRNKLLLSFYSILSFYFYKEFISKGFKFWNINRFKKLVYFTGRAYQVNSWIKNYLQNENDRKIILYTYWTNEITLGLIKRSKQLNIKLITRAHGHDIYEEYYDYLPCYQEIVSGISKLYTVSNKGYIYLTKKYPGHINKIFLSYLGVKKAKKYCSGSHDNIVRLVSCSYMIPLKRINLIINGITEFIKTYNKEVVWTHFGDGELYDEINNQADQVTDLRFKYTLKGFVTNNEVLRYYQENQVDLFITTSESEGVPVSLIEAQAYGIPVIGTNIGGIPEIVNYDVGVLLSPNPTNIEIAEAIYNIISSKKKHNDLRINSIANWKNKFDESVNFINFVSNFSN